MDRKELVEKMLDAYEGEPEWRQMPGLRVEYMDAALSVAIDELLKPPTREDEKLGYLLDMVLENRRAQLERVKTAEERVVGHFQFPQVQSGRVWRGTCLYGEV